MPSYKQYADGEAMMVVDGKQYRYKGTVPWTMSPWATANLGAALLELARCARRFLSRRRGRPRSAEKWDRITVAQWLDHHVPSKRRA